MEMYSWITRASLGLPVASLSSLEMNAITVKTTAGNTVLVNWNNVDYVCPTESYYGEKYNEIHFAGQHRAISTTETIEAIKEKLTNDR